MSKLKPKSTVETGAGVAATVTVVMLCGVAVPLVSWASVWLPVLAVASTWPGTSLPTRFTSLVVPLWRTKVCTGTRPATLLVLREEVTVASTTRTE